MFENTFKNIDDILWKEAGCSTELDYIEQTSWVLFLKYLDDFEHDRRTAAELAGKTYTDIISPEYRWGQWAMPKGKDGKLDHHKALTGDDLKDFVDHKLFPYLKKFKADAERSDTIEYKIGEIFSELKNKISSGYNLREILNLVDELRFRSSAEKHEMSHLYEDIHNVDGAIVAYAGRWPGDPPEDTPKYKFPAGFRKSMEVFNLYRALQADTTMPLVIVEGFFDCIHLWEIGCERVVGLMGSQLSKPQEELIVKSLNEDDHILVMLDEDEAGRAGREQVLQRLATRAFVKVFQFPQEGQQPTDLSGEELRELIGGAE